MRKWDDPPAPFVDSDMDPDEGSEGVRHRARAFRRWLARGADPGGLRALAAEEPLRMHPADERPADRGERGRDQPGA